jgi:hypothetical protein
MRKNPIDYERRGMHRCYYQGNQRRDSMTVKKRQLTIFPTGFVFWPIVPRADYKPICFMIIIKCLQNKKHLILQMLLSD